MTPALLLGPGFIPVDPAAHAVENIGMELSSCRLVPTGLYSLSIGRANKRPHTSLSLGQGEVNVSGPIVQPCQWVSSSLPEGQDGCSSNVVYRRMIADSRAAEAA